MKNAVGCVIYGNGKPILGFSAASETELRQAAEIAGRMLKSSASRASVQNAARRRRHLQQRAVQPWAVMEET